jgi:hypothetical protein
MSRIATSLSRVRRSWHLLRMLRATSVLLVLASVLALSLIATDLIYHLPQRPRLALLAVAVALLVAAAIQLVRRAGKPLSDSTAALMIEAGNPALQGLALAASELRQRQLRAGDASAADAADDEVALLNRALLVEAEQQLDAIDPTAAVDKRPMLRSAAAAAAMLIAGALMVLLAPARAGHELARALIPWIQVPPTAAELAAQRRADELAQQARDLALARQKAADEAAAPVVFTVAPGAIEVMRGGSIAVQAGVSRVDGPAQLQLTFGDGNVRTVPMSPAADDSKSFTTEVADLADDATYCVVMGASHSPSFPISVYDQVQVSDLHVDYKAPDYARQPPRTSKGGDIEALVGSTAHLSIAASGALDQVHMTMDDGTAVPVLVHGDHAEVDVPVTTDGGFHLSAEDTRGHHPVTGLAAHYAIHAIPDLPPTISLLYPSIDTAVHPMERIAIAAQAEDDVGLKEVRLVSTYCIEDPQVEHRSCLNGPLPLKQLLCQFTIDLKQRPQVRIGDTIVFHLEVEDLKGQKVTTDPYILTVRGIEAMMTYKNGNNPGANGQLGAGYVTLLGALHDLEARRDQLTPEQFQAECEHIGDLYTFKPIAH